MIVKEYIDKITKDVKNYYLHDPEKSIMRNKHMNKLAEPVSIDPEIIKAFLVDFVNYSCAQSGVDLGLYTVDL